MRILFLILFIVSLNLGLSAQKLRQVTSLQGYWSFSIGDDLSWRWSDHDFSDWDKIYVGRSWESQGYDGYNGYAWYKRKVEVPTMSANAKLILQIDQIDDADEVYFNGVLIGHSGSFPPNVQTAYSQLRQYPVPHGLIYPNGKNLIAVRVYDTYLNGGILGQAGLYVDVASAYILQDLSGSWRFKPGDNANYSSFGYNHADWDTLNVPGTWESQGYPYLDGYAWYRKSFTWDKPTMGDDMVVVLGRIDDRDVVYLNGNRIGSVDEIKKGPYYTGKPDYQTLRAYRISRSMLNKGQNILAVRVRDDRLEGGMYDGPIGIMTLKAFESYFSEHEESKNLFEYFLDRFFD